MTLDGIFGWHECHPGLCVLGVGVRVVRRKDTRQPEDPAADGADREPASGRSWLVGIVLVAVVAAGVAWWSIREQPIEVELATAAAAPAGWRRRAGCRGAERLGLRCRAARGDRVRERHWQDCGRARSRRTWSSREGQLLAGSTIRRVAAARASRNPSSKRGGPISPRSPCAERKPSQNCAARAAASGEFEQRGRRRSGAVRGGRSRGRFAALERAVDVAEARERARARDRRSRGARAVRGRRSSRSMPSPASGFADLPGGGFTRTGIATLVDMQLADPEVDVDESFINRAQAGQKTVAVLDADPAGSIPSHAINIVPMADRQATVKVRIGFDELDPRIRSNMAVEVTFLGSMPPASRAPARAPQRRGRWCACRRAPSSATAARASSGACATAASSASRFASARSAQARWSCWPGSTRATSSSRRRWRN